MYLLNDSLKKIHIYSNTGIKELKVSDYFATKKYIEKKYTKYEENLGFDYFLNGSLNDSKKNFLVISSIHHCVFQINIDLLYFMSRSKILKILFGFNKKIFQTIMNHDNIVVAFGNIELNEIPIISINTKQELYKYGIQIITKDDNDNLLYRTTISHFSLGLGRYLDGLFIDTRALGTDKDIIVSQNKAISESLERLNGSIICDKSIKMTLDQYLLYDSRSLLLVNNYEYSYLMSDEREFCLGENLSTRENCYLPAHFIFYPYCHIGTQEWMCNSSGMAAHLTYEKAIESGLLELIERDAFLLCRLTKSGVKKIKNDILGKYNLGFLSHNNIICHVYSLEFDNIIPVVMCISEMDKKCIISLGVGFSLKEALERCYCETLQGFAFFDQKLKKEDVQGSVLEHTRHYLDPTNYSKLNRLISLKGEDITEKNLNLSLNQLINEYRKQKINFFSYGFENDLNTCFKRKCVRVLSDSLLPIYFGNTIPSALKHNVRLKKIIGKKEINKNLHPLG